MQIWRFFTCFFVGSLGLPFLMHLVFLYRYSTSLEHGTFAGRTGDYLWMQIVTGITLLVFLFFFNFFYKGIKIFTIFFQVVGSVVAFFNTWKMFIDGDYLLLGKNESKCDRFLLFRHTIPSCLLSLGLDRYARSPWCQSNS